MTLIRKGRTAMMTINDLFESPRLKIAVENFDKDRQLLKAIFVEIVAEATQVAKNRIISEYSKHSKFHAFEMIPHLRSVTDFTKWNIHWGLSPEEIQLYLIDPKFKLTKQERLELQDKVRKRFMGSSD